MDAKKISAVQAWPCPRRSRHSAASWGSQATIGSSSMAMD
jgi:hypothetical protein